MIYLFGKSFVLIIRRQELWKKISPDETLDLEYVIENLAGRHTITVELLAYLARTKIWPVGKLREKLEEKGFCLEFHKDGKIVNIQESYEALYDLSELMEAEQNILEAFSVFPYIPFAENILEKLDMVDNLEQIVFISAVAYLLYYVAEYKKAEALYEKSLKINEVALGEDPPYTAAIYNNLIT